MSVSVGVSDASLVMQGGAALEKRMKDFQSAKKNADEALAALQLGRSARDVYADAQRKQIAAAKVLTDANVSAAEIVRVARAEADAMRADADLALRRASQVSAAADAADSQAKKRLADAETQAKLAEAQRQQHEAAAVGARAVQAKFHGLIAELQAVMKKV